MDEVTNNLVTSFVDYMEKELLENKEFKAFRNAKIVHWSLKEFRLTLDLMLDEKRLKLYFDIRELKDNPHHFIHLMGNAADQLNQQGK